MTASAILAGGTAVTAAVAAVPLAVAAVASPINRARDNRRQAVAETHTETASAALAAQILAGAHAAELVDTDPAKLAAAAHGAASTLAAGTTRADAPFIHRTLDVLAELLAAHGATPPAAASTEPSLSAAAELLLLLHRLRCCFGPGPDRYRATVATGAAIEAVAGLPDGICVSFRPLTEFDPIPLHRAQAAWIQAARAVGMTGWTSAAIPPGSPVVPVSVHIPAPRREWGTAR